MNILLISDVYFPRINGVSRSIQILRQELHEQGHTTVLVAPDYENRQAVLFDSAESILRVPGNQVPFDPEDRYMKTYFLKRAYEYLMDQDYRFDIIHIHTPFQAHKTGIKWARKLNLPVVETYHTYFEEYFHCYIAFVPKFILSAIARHITRTQCKSLDLLIVPSTPVKQVIESYGIKTPVHIIPTGLNNDDYFQGTGNVFKQYYEIDASRPTIMYVGRIAFEKNIEFLLQVTRELVSIHPDILFIIAGEGPALNKLVHRVADLRISQNVKFVGYLSRNKMLRNCYSASDIFVFASRTETQGLVLLEAMAQGVPVVSTAMLGTKDVLSDGDGCVIAEENINDFTRKVSSLLKDPLKRQMLGQRGRAYSAKFSSQSMAINIVNAYKKAANIKLCTTPQDLTVNPAKR